MSNEAELKAVEKDLENLKEKIGDRLQSVRNELNEEGTCHINTCHRKEHENGKCENHYLRDKHAKRLYKKYDKPVASLAVQLMEFNVKEWLPDKDGTIGADHIRDKGLTRNQQRWLGHMNAKSETNLEEMIDQIHEAEENGEECPVCNGVPGDFEEGCTCDKAIRKIISMGVDGGDC